MLQKNTYFAVAAVVAFSVVGVFLWYASPFTPEAVVVTTYSITASASDGGTITPAGTITVEQGSYSTFTINPNQGYKVFSLLVDNATTTATSTYTFSTITANHSLQVSFVPTYYTVDTNAVYHKGSIAAGVDPKTFSVVADSYGKDRRGIFYATGERIPDADQSSFKVLSDEYAYATDSEYVFWASSQIFEADVATFRHLGETYAVDKNHVYYTNQVLEDADVATFEFKGNGYAQDKNAIYYLGQKFTLSSEIPLPLGYGYSGNADGIFYSGYEVEGADIASFEPLSDYYAKDKYAVYYQMGKIPEAATTTFEVIGRGDIGTNVARDASFVYSEYVALPLNPKTVRVLGDHFLTDETSVYFTQDKVEGADPRTFAPLGYNYASDISGLWSGTQFVASSTKQVGAKDTASLYRYIGDAFITDGTVIYRGSEVLPGADPRTFRFIAGSYYAYDADSVFYGSDVIATNAEGFTIFGPGADYVKTTTEVFLRGVKIEGADAATFKVSEDGYYATDKNYKYQDGIQVAESIY